MILRPSHLWVDDPTARPHVKRRIISDTQNGIPKYSIHVSLERYKYFDSWFSCVSRDHVITLLEQSVQISKWYNIEGASRQLFNVSALHNWGKKVVRKLVIGMDCCALRPRQANILDSQASISMPQSTCPPYWRSAWLFSR